MRRCLVTLLAGALLAGCPDPERPPPPPPRDAGPAMDAGSFDAGIRVRRDAGPSAPVIDGTVDDVEWMGAETKASLSPIFCPV